MLPAPLCKRGPAPGPAWPNASLPPPSPASPDRLACHPAAARSPLTQALGKRLPFSFLADVSQLFQGRYAAVASGAVAYEMNTEFAPVLRDRMHFFNTDPRWEEGVGAEGWGGGVRGEGGDPGRGVCGSPGWAGCRWLAYQTAASGVKCAAWRAGWVCWVACRAWQPWR